MAEDILKGIAEAICELEDSEKIKGMICKALSSRIPVIDIIEKGLRRGLDLVGQKYEAGEYFLAELLAANAVMSDVLQMLSPHLSASDIRIKGTIVLGTVRGDLHDIGKNIFKMLALAAGFKVCDLGVDVEPETFVKKVKEFRPGIVGLSALLTTTMYEMKTVLDKLKEAELRSKVKVLIGGNPITEDFASEIGADAAAKTAVEGIEICKKWVGEG